MPRNLLGLEIRNNGIRAIRVKHGIREVRVQAFMEVPFSPAEEWEPEWRNALDLIHEQMDLAAAECVVSLPADWFSFRNLRLPFRNKKKIEQVLPYELESYLPFPVEQLHIGYLMVDTPSEESSEVELITAAIVESTLARLTDLLDRFRAKITAVSVGGYPTARVLAESAGITGRWLLVDTDSVGYTLFLADAGGIHFLRPFPDDTDGQSLVDTLGLRIQQTMMAYQEICGRPFHVETVYVNGPLGQDGRFSESLSRRVKLPVKPLDLPLRTPKKVLLPEGRKWNPATVHGPLSLVLWKTIGSPGFDFSRDSSFGEIQWSKYRSGLIKTGGLGLLLSGLIWYNSHLEIRATQEDLNQIDSKIAETFRSAYPEVKKVVDPLLQMRQMMEITRKEAVVSGLSGGRPSTVEILDIISRQIPQTLDVQLTRLDIGPESALMRGSADSFNTVDTIKGNLDRAAAFKGSSITSTSKDKADNRVQFQIKIQM